MSKTLQNATLSEIRQALAGGRPDATLAEAIDELRQAEIDAVERERQAAKYGVYVDMRAIRRSVAVAEAARLAVTEAEADAPEPGYRKFRNLTGTSIGDPQRDHAGREAASQAAAEFDVREPLLQQPEWDSAGQPATYQLGALRRTAARAKGLVS